MHKKLYSCLFILFFITDTSRSINSVGKNVVITGNASLNAKSTSGLSCCARIPSRFAVGVSSLQYVDTIAQLEVLK